jgi:hypothetical protein
MPQRLPTKFVGSHLEVVLRLDKARAVLPEVAAGCAFGAMVNLVNHRQGDDALPLDLDDRKFYVLDCDGVHGLGAKRPNGCAGRGD